MKKLAWVTVILAFSFTSFCQKLNAEKVPAVVKEGLKNFHPNVLAGWEREDANYEANFMENGRQMSCILNRQGTILETETLVAIPDLPPPARNYLEQHYKNKKISEVSFIEKRGGQKFYEVVVPGKELLFDAAGNFKEAEKEKKEKD